MSDLIERQAAIDAMAELQGRASTKAELKGISKAWKWIKKLPSVQPERTDKHTETHACDCISRQGAIDADELMELLTTAIRNMKGIAKLIGAEDDPEIKMKIKAYTDIANWVKDAPTIEPERKTGQWIPVTERLPEGGGFYIVTENVSEDGDKWVGLRWYSTVHGWEFDPVAWMPLPEPYQEEGDSE